MDKEKKLMFEVIVTWQDGGGKQITVKTQATSVKEFKNQTDHIIKYGNPL